VPTPQRLSSSNAVRIIRTVTDLDELGADWEQLTPQTAEPGSHFLWARTSAETHPDAEPHVVVVGDPPSAIAPLACLPDRARTLTWLGAALHEPSDLLWRHPTALHQLADAIARLGRPLDLPRIPAGSEAVPALRSALRTRGLQRLRSTPGAPFIALDEGWADSEPQHLRSRRRADLRRSRRRAERFGEVRFAVHQPSEDEASGLLETAFRVEASGWKQRTGTALQEDQLTGAFFTSYGRAAARRGMLRVALLLLGGKPAAMQIAVETGGRYWLLKIGYDAAFARCSPGTLLLAHTVQLAARRGLQTYELLGVDEPWTAPWATGVRRMTTLRHYPFRPGGGLALAADAWGRIQPRRDSDEEP
jgi:CelD/BcsL family acetyltransferase involved in cellulose biosynthesis